MSRWSWLAVLAVAIVLAAPVGAAASQKDRPPVIPPFGKLYDVLSTKWWQYVLAQPKSTNPLLDTTGASCRTGQSGPVFFLVGTTSGTAVRDECTVPWGRALFFPLVNGFDVHTPGDGLDTPAQVWHDFTVNLGFRVDSLHASVDGIRVRNLDPASSPYRGCAAPVAGCASPFSLTLPPDNLFAPLPAGTYAPAVADGFYLLLAPLPPGSHTIRFGGSGFLAPGEFTPDVTYHLRVVRR